MNTRKFTHSDLHNFLELDERFQECFDKSPMLRELKQHLTSNERFQSFLDKNEKVTKFLNSNPQFQQFLQLGEKNFLNLENFYKDISACTAASQILQSSALYGTFDLDMENKEERSPDYVGTGANKIYAGAKTFFESVAITTGSRFFQMYTLIGGLDKNRFTKKQTALPKDYVSLYSLNR